MGKAAHKNQWMQLVAILDTNFYVVSKVILCRLVYWIKALYLSISVQNMGSELIICGKSLQNIAVMETNLENMSVKSHANVISDVIYDGWMFAYAYMIIYLKLWENWIWLIYICSMIKYAEQLKYRLLGMTNDN